MKAKISEIFQSVQGEGKYSGVKQVFVRFFGCDMNCAWCDTPYARDPIQGSFCEMDCGQLLREIDGRWERCHSLSLTGGEPLLQKDFIKELLPDLKKAGRRIYLDTNGVDHQALKEIIRDIDIVAMDLKLPSSAGVQPFWWEHEQFLRIAAGKDVFIKAVIAADTQKEDIIRSVQLIAGVDPQIMLVLQPNSGQLAADVMAKCLEFQNYCLEVLSDVRIIPQTHKAMGIK